MVETLIGLLCIVGGSLLAVGSAYGRWISRALCGVLLVVPVAVLWDRLARATGVPLVQFEPWFRALVLIVEVGGLVWFSQRISRFAQSPLPVAQAAHASEGPAFVPPRAPRHIPFVTARAERKRARQAAQKRYESYQRVVERRQR